MDVGGKKLKKWDTVEPEYNDKTPISPSTEIGPMEAELADPRRSMLQYSTYAAKKTVAQGMMDIALITANANQLRYLIEFQRNATTFYLTLTLIIISIALQIMVGILLVFKGRVEKGQQKDLDTAHSINSLVVVLVLLVTVINVFIASFSISGTGVSQQPAQS
uniref:Ninjurin-1 n=1 Tax=Lygus hesperus TaxID=30085 RepID=A0A0K8SCV1_LYGHE